MSNNSHHSTWGDTDWDNPRSYGTVHPRLGERRRQEEAHRNATPSRRGQHDHTFQRSSSPPSVNSLYANPPSPTLRPGLQPVTGERYTSLQDVPHFSLNDNRGTAFPLAASDYKHGTLAAPKTPPQTLPKMEPQYCQRPPGLTHPLPEPLPKVLRVVNPDPPAPDESVRAESVASTDEPFRSQPRKKSESEKLKLTGPFTKKEDGQKIGGLLEIQTALEEKQKVGVGIKDVFRKLEAAFQDEQTQKSKDVEEPAKKAWCAKHYVYDTCAHEAEKREGCKYLSSAPPNPYRDSVNRAGTTYKLQSYIPGLPTRSETGKTGNETSTTVPKSSCTNPTRFADFVERQRAMRAAHIHHHHERRKHEEWLQRIAKKEKKQDEERKRAAEENMSIEGPITWGTETLSKMAPKNHVVETFTVNEPKVQLHKAGGTDPSKTELEAVFEPETSKEMVMSGEVISKKAIAQFVTAMAADKARDGADRVKNSVANSVASRDALTFQSRVSRLIEAVTANHHDTPESVCDQQN